jgi:hypothetical protein
MTVQDDQVSPPWRKARACGNSACVEFALVGEMRLVRDSKNPDGPWLTFDGPGWSAFVGALKVDQL